jgi:hypothetical protein
MGEFSISSRGSRMLRREKSKKHIHENMLHETIEHILFMSLTKHIIP